MNDIAQLNSLREEIVRVNLHSRGTTGNWTVGQIYFHLAAAFEATVEPSVKNQQPSFSLVKRIAMRPLLWFVTRVRFPSGIAIPPSVRRKLEPPIDADALVQYERLLLAIEQFASHEGDFPPHPVLGPLSPQEWLRFHIQHCRHHLWFIQT